MNTEKLNLAAEQGEVEMDLFYFNPKMINWDDYFMNVHIPGLFKYAIKWSACELWLCILHCLLLLYVLSRFYFRCI